MLMRAPLYNGLPQNASGSCFVVPVPFSYPEETVPVPFSAFSVPVFRASFRHVIVVVKVADADAGLHALQHSGDRISGGAVLLVVGPQSSGQCQRRVQQGGEDCAGGFQGSSFHFLVALPAAWIVCTVVGESVPSW
ncbi:MAG: hypothetical protein FJ276_10205 [Planctomycetes bacterium]|nr:hypothetical protein [Planctomycetota bacterium]